MASIERARTNKGGWSVRYRDPRGNQRSKTFDRKVDAQRFASTAEADVLRGTWTDPAGARVRFDEWAAQYWDTTVNLRDTSRVRDRSYYATHVEPAFAGLPIGVIDHLMVREWIAGLTSKGLAPATVHKAHQVLAKIMRAAVAAGLIPASPCDNQALPRVERQEMRFLAPDEVERLADSIDPRYRALVLVGAYGGLRAGELFGLRRGRVEVAESRLYIVENLVEVRGHHQFGPPKTRAGRRSVPLPASIMADLVAHLDRVGATGADLVFAAPAGGPVRPSLFRRRVWKPAVTEAGLAPLRLHDLRHTAVAFWIEAGASPTEIAARAGHTSVVTVLDRYGHLLPGSDDRVTAALDRMVEQVRDVAVAPEPAEVCEESAKVIPLHSPMVAELAPDQDLFRGRYGTRTHDLCRVKAAL
jgi:integrase